MNKTEMRMLDLLKHLRQEHGAVSVKAEFEAEGTRTDELLRLIDIARRADLMVSLKIGGCEAVRDMIESKQFGVDYIIAPMVETPYALKKYVQAKNKAYTDEQQQYTKFLFNLETITTFNALPEMLKLAQSENGAQGVVFGRVDFAGSLDKPRAAIDTDEITGYVIKVAEALRGTNLDLVVGGAIAIDSLPALREIYAKYLTRFETRKVVFSSEALDNPSMAAGLKQTVFFELLWLENKRDYYASIQNEDAGRIKMLRDRWEQLGA